MRKWCC